MPTIPNATRADIIAMLQDGHSNNRIARELHCDRARIRRLRTELGLPQYVPAERTRTLEDKWRMYARPIDGGHMEWTGELASSSNTPLLRYKEQAYGAAAVAFRIRTGRDPQGYVLADCGRRHCVAPDHVEDEPNRTRNREQLRYLMGGQQRKPVCVAGHDQDEHGRCQRDGVAYCAMCKRDAKRAVAS